MADKYYYLKGKSAWAKIKNPDKEYECYSVDLFLDGESKILFKDSGLQLKVKSTEDGDYIRLRRPLQKNFKDKGVVDNGPPQVLLKNADGDYTPFDDFIGNGSEIICKVRVYDTNRGKGHELTVVAIEKLVEYKGAEEVGGDDLPF
jgi:hypothetical protein